MLALPQLADVLLAGVLGAYVLVAVLGILLQAISPKPRFRSILSAWREAWTAVPGGPRFWLGVQLANVGMLIGVVGVIIGASTVLRLLLSSIGIVMEVIGIVILTRIWLSRNRAS